MKMLDQYQKTLNLIKYYAVDSINTVVISDQPDNKLIYNAIEQGMNTIDNLLENKMYSHLNEFSIEKKVILNPLITIECDLLVLDSKDLDYLEKNFLKYISYVSDIIFISKIDGVDKLIDLKDR
jgi:GTP:adenosylcobinamide-phosphate guanylyltransferase